MAEDPTTTTMTTRNRKPTNPNKPKKPKNLLVSSVTALKRQETHQKKAKSGGFESLGLSLNIFRAVKRKGYRVPTPIQRKAMPLILAGSDVVAMARTGSGKTAAFLIPMLEKLKEHVPQGGVRGLILSPTRDLALQTLKFTKELGRYTDLRTCLLVGGDRMEAQFEELAQNPDIIIATPGRLMHHLAEVDDMSLRSVEYVVFDEADSLFGMGFAEQLHQILSQLSENRQTLLFSATLPSGLAEFAKAGLRDHQLIRLDVESRISPDLKLTFFTLRQEEKYAALLHLIREEISSDEQTLIFVATKYDVEFLKLLFELEGIGSSICYGEMDQDARKINVSKFRARKTMLLIVTDVAARGIDIPLLDNVINWDFPPKPKIFVHRVGRVARNGRTGTAYSFLTSEDMAYLLDLHLFLSRPVRPAPSEEEVLKDVNGVMEKIDQAMANGESVYGRFPQTVLDLVQDKIRDVIDSSADLSAQQRSCTNAHRAYSKSKPMPSKESIRRVKDLPREGLHPMFKGVLGGNELTALAFSERLKSFRPKQTVLEAEGDNAKSKNRQGPSRQWVDVMKKKRAIHEKIITKVHEKHSSDKAPEWYSNVKAPEQLFSDEEPEHNSSDEETEQHSSDKAPEQHPSSENATEEAKTAVDSVDLKEKTESVGSKRKAKRGSGRTAEIGSKKKAKAFVDEEYFISPVPTNQHLEAGLAVQAGFGNNRFESAVMDLVADDNAGIQKQKSVYHWDKKSKKYIKLNNGDRVTASGKIRTEGGAKVRAQKTGIYKKWKSSTHNKIAFRETDTEGNVKDMTTSGGGRFNPRFKNGGQRRSIPNAHVPSEIKNLDQVRKERQNKAMKQSYAKNKSTNGKGNKFGKNGKKRNAR